MSASLFFYDLETSGLHPDLDRIMQFAGQRTDTNLKPIGQPINVLIKLSQDILPDPSAVLLHGISPQQTIAEGLSEAEFLRQFYSEVALPGTTFVGFNNIRFDDEFIRYLNYRNLYDPYAWSYENNASRWDILDVVRLTRALRPEGINWPKTAQGKSVNRLELLSSANNLVHESAHDALSDVLATIEVAKLIKLTQPKLFDYLFELRKKAAVIRLVEAGLPFIYTSSHYPSELLHTTAVVKVADHPDKNCVMVYDLRYDPSIWLDKDAKKLADAWRYVKDRPVTDLKLPVKTMRLNRCPAIAPLGVLKDEATQDRLDINLGLIAKHTQMIKAKKAQFSEELIKAVEILNKEQDEMRLTKTYSVEQRLYDGFYSDVDRELIKDLHQNESAEKIRSVSANFKDERLKKLAKLFLARNYSSDLSQNERRGWEEYVHARLFDGGPSSKIVKYFSTLQALLVERNDSRSQILLEDLKLYGESILPSDIGD